MADRPRLRGWQCAPATGGVPKTDEWLVQHVPERDLGSVGEDMADRRHKDKLIRSETHARIIEGARA